MSYKRFFAVAKDEGEFKFVVDTTKINVGATDGSQSNLSFRIPFETRSNGSAGTNCIIRVSDGRPDILINGHSEAVGPKSLLVFQNPGVYTISIIGVVTQFTFYGPSSAYDLRKIVKILLWSEDVTYGTRCFYGCINLEIDAPNALILGASPSWFFQGIKGFISSPKLIDVSNSVDISGILNLLANPLPDTLNPFLNKATALSLVYGVTFGYSVDRIEIISKSLTVLYQPWNGTIFSNPNPIRLIIKTPNLQQMFRVFYSGEVRTRCHAGEIDVRNVTDTNQWLSYKFTTAQVDATLLGWANNLPFMQAGVVWNWNGSKYSNNPAVIAAYNKITQQWGVIFTNLTMA